MSEDSETVAVITDIHGSLAALQATLTRINELGIARVFCGGDLVGYGPHANEVRALVAEHDIPTTYGNHDYAIARDACSLTHSPGSRLDQCPVLHSPGSRLDQCPVLS